MQRKSGSFNPPKLPARSLRKYSLGFVKERWHYVLNFDELSFIKVKSVQMKGQEAKTTRCVQRKVWHQWSRTTQSFAVKLCGLYERCPQQLLCCTESGCTKEYISVIEGTLGQYPPASSKHLPNQPLPPPALSDSQVVGVSIYCRQSRERLVGQMFGQRRGVLSVLLLIYILCSAYTMQIALPCTHSQSPTCQRATAVVSQRP